MEPAGPPFVKHPVLGEFTYGLTAVPVSFGPGEDEGKLGGLPVAVVTAECSGFEPSCRATAEFLRELRRGRDRAAPRLTWAFTATGTR